MKRISVCVLLVVALAGCAGWQGHLLNVAKAACLAADDAAAEEFISEEDLEKARSACRLARIAAGLPPSGEVGAGARQPD